MFEPLPVSSEQVAAFQGLVEHHARKFSNLEVPLAEYDDLVQVGMIRVWTLLRRGIPPAEWAIRAAMKDELRRCGRLEGRAGERTSVVLDHLDREFLALDGADI